ncbi:MAG TPA: DUF3795 domain-containing protein [Methanomassiliicoccales archaeon]|nr:DUF3795 domain-containing protein [Methanomassiliicoccales archaeon]
MLSRLRWWKMLDMIAYCGLDCRECDFFKATRTNDQEWKERLAKKWADGLQVECDGCKSDRISGWCSKKCKVRPCAEKKGVRTCADCKEFQCDVLRNHLLSEPVASKNLEEMRKGLQS